jgi:hypothetical protein
MADDMAICKKNEVNLWESVFVVRKLRNVCKFKISTTNTIVMDFENMPNFLSKISVHNNLVTEPISDFSYLGCKVKGELSL